MGDRTHWECIHEGARFEIFNESAIISSLEFLDIMSQVCASYSERYPDEGDLVRDMVDRLAIRLRDDFNKFRATQLR